MEKKVLILSYEFPPYTSVASLRPFSWYKNFKKFDLEPIVITRQWNNLNDIKKSYVAPSDNKKDIIEKDNLGTIIKTAYKPNLSNRLLLRYGDNNFKITRKLLTGFFEIFQFILPIGSKRKLFIAADNYLKKNNVDIIIATGDPFVLFHYANKLSKKHRVPWIADYRDNWSNDVSIQKRIIFKHYLRIVEKKIVRNATAISTVSPFIASHIKKVVGNNSIKIFPNGFDKKLTDIHKVVEQEKNILNIGFAGTIYNWNPIYPFLNDLSKILTENEIPLKLNFYGVNISSELISFIKDNHQNLESIINFEHRMPNERLLQKLASNNVLLLFNYYSFLGTKIYDYLGLKRRILLCYTNDKVALEIKEKHYTIDEVVGQSNQLQAELIQKTQSGIVLNSSKELKETLLNLSKELLEKKTITCNSIGISEYTREVQVKKMSSFIHSIISKKNNDTENNDY